MQAEDKRAQITVAKSGAEGIITHLEITLLLDILGRMISFFVFFFFFYSEVTQSILNIKQNHIKSLR